MQIIYCFSKQQMSQCERVETINRLIGIESVSAVIGVLGPVNLLYENSIQNGAFRLVGRRVRNEGDPLSLDTALRNILLFFM